MNATKEQQTPHTPCRTLFVITSTGTGGTESILREMVPRLDNRVITPAVCSLREPGIVADDLRGLGVPVSSLHASEHPRAIETVMSVFSLASSINRLKIDLVHTMLYRANAVGSLASRLSRTRPIIVTSQRSLDPITGRIPVATARFTRRFSERIVAVSNAVRDHLIAGEGIPESRIVVIANGVDTKRFQPSLRGRDCSPFRQETGGLAIGAAGRLTKVKGLDSLLLAVGALPPAAHPIRVRIAGDGPERIHLERLAGELGIAGQVEFLGEVRNMLEFYSSIDLFVLSSLREGSPNVVLEAMAMGLPVVATRVGGVPEIIEPGRSGILVDREDPASIARILGELRASPDSLESMGVGARHRIETRFSIAETARNHQNLFSELFRQLRDPETGRSNE